MFKVFCWFMGIFCLSMGALCLLVKMTHPIQGNVLKKETINRAGCCCCCVGDQDGN